MSLLRSRQAVARIGLGGFAIAAFGTVSASAATGIYHSRQDFLAANPIVTTQDFSAPFATGVSVDFGDFTATTHPTTLLERLGGRLNKMGNGNSPHFVTFEFDEPVFALGIDIFDFGNPSTGELRAITNTGTVDYQIATYSNGNPEINLFWGVIDTDGFTSITLSNMTIGDSIQFDDLQYRTVPEPSAALLLAGGAAMSLVSRRRR